MNRLLQYRPAGIMLSLWVMVFSIAAPLGLVLCSGHHGHLALEFPHEGQACEASAGLPNTLSANGFKGCSDTPIISDLGRFRTTTLPILSDRDSSPAEGIFSRADDIKYDGRANEADEDYLAPDHVLEALLTAILIC